jgi:S-adenosylmethionine:tRNA ribosyltransferase-isomerase
LSAEHRWCLADFDYELPPELVAQVPIADRTASRMLAVRRSGSPLLADLAFSDLLNLIPPGDLLAINTTRVRPARLIGTRPSGAPAEVLLIRPAADGATWIAMGKPGSALQPGKRVQLSESMGVETVTVLPDGHRQVRFVGGTAEEVIRHFGRVPLPPYIQRDAEPMDFERYQTVYAKREGSVAAPTAGLHFSNQLLDALSAKGVVVAGLDLEIGSGTFKPVETENVADHSMHAERYEIPERLAALTNEVRRMGGKVWAVGTTVVRALESAADDQGKVQAGRAETSLLILPGFRFRVVDRLITNFHLPRSTLLMLVSAFAGHETMHAAYHHAVARRYRFYSYGDAMVIL